MLLVCGQILLVEPCDMVRQVLQLALRAWGTSVCAVKTEEEAISVLQLRSMSHIPLIPHLAPRISFLA